MLIEEEVAFENCAPNPLLDEEVACGSLKTKFSAHIEAGARLKNYLF